MGRGVRVLLAVVLLLTGMQWLPAAATAGTDDGWVYFKETGFWVDPLIAGYWEANGGLMTFGYPVSRLFYQDGLHKQYFERAIFEHHEDKAGSQYAVLLTRLGALNTVERRKTELPFQPRPAPVGGSSHELFFPETGHALSSVFREYWETHGGIQTFGYPLSDAFIEPGLEDGVPHVVQYFERARFEHHPDLAGTEFEILLGHLGKEALAQRGAPEIALTQQSPLLDIQDTRPIGPRPHGAPTPVQCGFNYAHWSDVANDPTNQWYLDMAVESGCTWLRLQFTWRDLEPLPGYDMQLRMWPYDRIVDLANERGLQLLVNVTNPPDWARPRNPSIPAEPTAFANFFERLAEHFQGRVDAWQIWNEPNLHVETNGEIDPLGFFPMVKAAYPAIKRGDPDAIVVFPGLAPNSMFAPHLAVDDLWYLESIFAINNGEVANYFDVLGVQAYGAGNDPDSYWPGNLDDNPGWTTAPEFYFRRVEAVHNLLVAAGMQDKPVWITEMGWPAGDYHDVYGYGEWISEELQAEYLERAFEIMRTEWHWVDHAFIWHFNFADYGGNWSPYAGFSIIRVDKTMTPAFETIVKESTNWRETTEAEP